MENQEPAVVEKKWYKKWWAFLTFVFIGLTLFPLTLGFLISYVLYKVVKNPNWKWPLITLIIFISTFFGSRWFKVIYDGITLPPKREEKVLNSNETTPSLTPKLQEPTTPIVRKLQYESSGAYMVGDEKWESIVIPVDSTKEEVVELARELHRNNLDVHYNIFDDDTELDAYIRRDKSQSNPTVYFPEEWDKQHFVGMINQMVTENGIRWQFYSDSTKYQGIVDLGESELKITPMTLIPESQSPRKIVKGSTSKGIEFYNKVDELHKQGKVIGELYTEFESDPIVDVNPEMQSVQLSLKYSSITENVDKEDKNLISIDFKVIKGLAEQDKSLILSEYGTLRLFVLTYHDIYGIGRGDVQQLMIDEAPSWSDWD